MIAFAGQMVPANVTWRLDRVRSPATPTRQIASFRSGASTRLGCVNQLRIRCPAPSPAQLAVDSPIPGAEGSFLGAPATPRVTAQTAGWNNFLCAVRSPELAATPVAPPRILSGSAMAVVVGTTICSFHTEIERETWWVDLKQLRDCCISPASVSY